MAGAFQTSRDVFENPIWQNIVEFRLFFLIYGKATFVDGVKIGSIELQRGQWIRSFRNLQSDLEYIENRSVKRYSLSTIHRAVDNLVKDERIKIKECKLGTLFEVVNYSKYQGLENYRNDNENAERTEKEQKKNRKRTTTEQQENNNNKVLIRVNNAEQGKEKTALEIAIDDFKDFRKKIKSPMTDRAVKLLLTELEKLTSDDETKIAIINQSIMRGWKGVFPLKEGRKSESSNPFA